MLEEMHEPVLSQPICQVRSEPPLLTIHIEIICLFVCLFDLIFYVPCQQFLSHAGMISGLPGSN